MRIALCAALLSLALPALAQRPKSTACSLPDQPVAVTGCAPASIYVADFDRAAIEEILSRHFDGFTLLPARGCWHKICENSLVIQVAGAAASEIRKAAEELRVAGRQEQVIVVIPRLPPASVRRQVPRR